MEITKYSTKKTLDWASNINMEIPLYSWRFAPSWGLLWSRRRCCWRCGRSWPRDRSPSSPASGSIPFPAGSWGTERSPHSTASRGRWWQCDPPGYQLRPCGGWTGWSCVLKVKPRDLMDVSGRSTWQCLLKQNLHTWAILEQQVPDAPARVRIDSSCRLIQDHDLWPANKRQRYW